MNKLLLLLGLIVCISCNQETKVSETEQSSEQSESPKQIVSISEGVAHPESIVLAPSGDFLFVSNMAENQSEESPNGFISKVSLTGEILDLKWVDNIRAPKGICIANGKLYVSAVKELLEISLEDGKIMKRHTSDDVVFLNDVTADSKGNIYVSGMKESAIYKLDREGHFTEWYQNDEFNHPNGVFVSNDEKIYVGTWGRVDEYEN